MTLEPSLVEAFVIECTESRCQTAKCLDERELRGEDVFRETELNVRRELEESLDFILRLG
jgi:hypothetical protein